MSLFSGELYISPLQAQLQMKPSFDYLDKADVKIDKKAAEMEGGMLYSVGQSV